MPAFSGWEEGLHFYNKGNYAAAYKQILPLAEQNDSKAQNMLAHLFYNGWGVNKDYAQSARWFHASASQGNPDSQWKLGRYFLLNGRGVQMDVAAALLWIEKAAEQGLAEAQGYAGFIYWVTGPVYGLPENREKGWYWTKKAAESGDGYSQNYMAKLYLKGHPSRGIEVDYAQARKWFELASNSSDPHAMSNAFNSLAGMYESGLGVQTNKQRAFDLYLQSAKIGNSDAQRRIAEMYRDGNGIGRDLQFSYAWFEVAGTKPARFQGEVKENEGLLAMRDAIGRELKPASI
jgi:TPR repeat protein